MENLTFKNIDILEQDEDDPDYQGCMAITDGDLNLIRNVRFEDVRVEDFQEGQLFNLRVVNNAKYNTGPGRGIENVSFKNIFYDGINLKPSIIMGLDKNHSIKNVSFENIVINGKQLANPNATEHIVVGPFASGVISKNKKEYTTAIDKIETKGSQ